MKTSVHVINVDQGNMVLIEVASGEVLLCDCNVTEDNEGHILPYLRHVLAGRRIHAFICTHRDADHMRGINRVHTAVGVDRVWDSGQAGGDIYSPEYGEYMRMRRAVPSGVLESFTYFEFGRTCIRVLSAACEDLPDEPNSQSIVLKVEHGPLENAILLTADSDVATWRKIRERYDDAWLRSEILLGGHHGSWTFFDCDSDTVQYVGHMNAINPAMTLLSVGKNPYGHPDEGALRVYESRSRGSADGHRVWRTDNDGTMRLDLQDGAPWRLWRWRTAPLSFFLPFAGRPAPPPTPSPGLLALLGGPPPPPPNPFALLFGGPPKPKSFAPPRAPSLAELVAEHYRSRVRSGRA